MQSLNSLRELLAHVPSQLVKLAHETVESRATPSSWSQKEELGHLLDSAANNHQRIVHAQLEEKPAMPGYNQNCWVAVHAYHQRDWAELIDLWRALNRQFLAAAEAVPDSAWSHTLTVGASEPLTLQFVFEDYIAHMVHHLRHIGIEVDDIISNRTNAA